MTFEDLMFSAMADELEKIAKTNVMRALKDPALRRKMLGWFAKTEPEAAGQMMKRHLEMTGKAGGGPKLTEMPAEVLVKRMREAQAVKARPPINLEERLAQGIPHKLVGAKATQKAPPGAIKFNVVSQGPKPGPAPAFVPYGPKPIKGLPPLPRAA